MSARPLQPDDLQALAVKLARIADLLEQRSASVIQQTLQAAETIDRSAKAAATSSEHITTRAIGEFRGAATSAIAEGMRGPMEQAGRTMQNGTLGIERATAELEQRVRSAGKVHSAHAWKTFIASALASIVVMSTAVYMANRSYKQISQDAWVGQINAAIANGKLTKCEGGGLCARIGKRWVRLDK